MRWMIRGLNVRVSDAIAVYARRKLFEPLKRFERHVNHVSVRLEDREPGRFPMPRCASVVVTLHDGAVIRLKQEDRTFFAAVDRLENRIREAVGRRLGRHRATRRRGAARSQGAAAWAAL